MRELTWQKSSFSSGDPNSDCVEMAGTPDGGIRLRESEDPDTVLAGIPETYRALLAHLKRGGHSG